mgnify:CR=1 FL=1
MRRRDLLAGLAGAGVLGGGVAVGGPHAVGSLSNGSVENGSDEEDRNGEDTRVTVPTTRIETFDAPGSEAGHREVPERGSPTVLEFFATTCAVCADYMETLRAVERDVDATFVSITVEVVGVTVERETVADWWREHDGAWTVGVDNDLTLSTALDAASVPFTAVLDGSNAVVHAGAGAMTEHDLRDAIDRA